MFNDVSELCGKNSNYRRKFLKNEETRIENSTNRGHQKFYGTRVRSEPQHLKIHFHQGAPKILKAPPTWGQPQKPPLPSPSGKGSPYVFALRRETQLCIFCTEGVEGQRSKF